MPEPAPRAVAQTDETARARRFAAEPLLTRATRESLEPVLLAFATSAEGLASLDEPGQRSLVRHALALDRSEGGRALLSEMIGALAARLSSFRGNTRVSIIERATSHEYQHHGDALGGLLASADVLPTATVEAALQRLEEIPPGSEAHVLHAVEHVAPALRN